MATKLRNDLWSIIAVTIALFTLLYCLSFFMETVLYSPATELLASLRTVSKGEI
ncbi:hypothetical protein [Planomicrobium okeanokoites]|uniref:hypothetical protein n=1 Tax=Planomicrobium okeanokoites TaxID=244 RepID=UPI00249276B9|nr:hypothetical protein [Planomicrobium okeanokoites]